MASYEQVVRFIEEMAEASRPGKNGERIDAIAEAASKAIYDAGGGLSLAELLVVCDVLLRHRVSICTTGCCSYGLYVAALAATHLPEMLREREQSSAEPGEQVH